MTRWKAALIHVLISFAIVGAVASYIIYFWYPLELIHMAKADKLLMLVGGVDLMIGPLLTLVVFRTGKPGLRFDLTVIAMLQAGFLSFGLYSIYASRPVYLVASATRFDLVFANEISPARLAQASDSRFASLGVTGPRLVGARMPTDAKEKNAILYSALAGNGDLETMPKYYVDYASITGELLAHSLPIAPNPEMTPAVVRQFRQAAQSFGRKPEEVRVLRLGSSRGFAAMLVESGTGKVLGPVNLDF
ncbi:MAG TPA: hypothetical protein VFW49_06630 [Fluviicoccus sp.]|nr:hypothetical protein [Fluviicoccus sp.]